MTLPRIQASPTAGTAPARTDQTDWLAGLPDPGGLAQQILRSTQEGIAILDRDLRYLAWSPSMEHLSGRPASEVLGRRPIEAFPELCAAGIHALLERALAGEQVRAPDLPVTSPSGERWISPMHAPLRSADGTIVGVVVMVCDVTERRRAESAHAETEVRLRAILDAEPECVKLLAEDGTLLDMNPAGLAMIEAESLAQVLGHKIGSLVLPDHRWAFAALTRRVFAGESGTLEFEMAGLKGGRRWLETHATPLRDGSGAIVASLGLTRDITAHKQATDALRESEHRFRQLAEAIRAVFWLRDVTTGCLLYISPAYEVIWGRSRIPLGPGEEWADSIHPDDRDRVLAASRLAHAAGRYEEEYRIVRPDGEERWIRDLGFPVVDGAGKVIRVAGIAEDVTERRRLEAHVLQAQKLESVGLLAGGVAHDFNNILTVVSTSAEELRVSLAEDAEAAGLIQDIQDAAARAAALTRQLLTFGRRDVPEVRVVDVNAVVGDTERMLRRLLGERVAIVADLSPGASSVRMDPGQLAQIVMNLAVNARDAMPAGGTLTLRTATDTDWIILTVADTGVGMPRDLIGRIFEPFFTTKGRANGTGLGLSVVHGIVVDAGGTIAVDSTPGAGTVFTIRLPLVAAAPDRLPSPETASAGASGGETVLLVEDEALVRRAAERSLQRFGYVVLTAASGTEALRMMASGDVGIDLLLTDLVMPGMNGRELADEMLASRPGLKVLYSSGYPDDTAVVGSSADDSGTRGFLAKPYTPAALVAKVREALDGR